MKYRKKRIVGLLLVLVFIGGILPQTDIQAKSEVSCKSLCSAVLKVTGGAKKLKYTSAAAIDFGGLSASERSRVKSIQYICDAKEVYSLCVIQAKSIADAKKLVKSLKKYKKNNCNNDYLSDYSKAERKVFKNAVYGRKGNFVWYISMSPKAATNKKGQTALKKKL